MGVTKVIDGLDIEWNGAKCDEIELREPRMSELDVAYGELSKAMGAREMTKFQVALVCAVSGKPQQIIAKMPVSKMNEAMEFLESFINSGQKTGET